MSCFLLIDLFHIILQEIISVFSNSCCDIRLSCHRHTVTFLQGRCWDRFLFFVSEILLQWFCYNFGIWNFCQNLTCWRNLSFQLSIIHIWCGKKRKLAGSYLEARIARSCLSSGGIEARISRKIMICIMNREY